MLMSMALLHGSSPSHHLQVQRTTETLSVTVPCLPSEQAALVSAGAEQLASGQRNLPSSLGMPPPAEPACRRRLV